MNQVNQMNQVQDDEIDLFELFQTLWDGKWLISAFVAIAVLLGGGYLLLTDAVYQTKIFVFVDSSVPLNKQQIRLKPFQQKFYIDFQSKFYAEKLFEDWKESNSNTSLVFEELSTTEVIDGFVLLKNEGEQLVSFELDKVGDTFILVNTNRLPLVLDVFKYANHINEMLKRDYVYQAKNDLKNTEVLIKNGGALDGNALESIISVKRFIDELEKGANVLTIQRPTMPKKVSPKSSLILVMSLVFGGMIGVVFILARNAITKRKEQLAKA